jgi:hypothetical protein
VKSEVANTEIAYQQHENVRKWVVANVEGIRDHSNMQKIFFVERTWSEWLQIAGWSDQSISQLFEIAPSGEVSRAQIREYAGSAKSSEDLRSLFALAMIWGRGKANGRMKNHLISILGNRDLDRALASSMAELKMVGPAASYQCWVDLRIPGIGPAFFTKWLWAAGCTNPAGNQAFVLDSRVWASLRKLGWNSNEAAGSRIRSIRYGAYVESCVRWSEGLTRVSAEDVEWALFDWNGGSNRDSNLIGPQ